MLRVRLKDVNKSKILDDRLVARLVTYMDGGPIVLGSPVVATSDPFSKQPHLVTSSCLRTDGVWVWDDVVTFVVNKYGFALPDRFIDHVLSSPTLLPAVDSNVVDDVFEWVLNS